MTERFKKFIKHTLEFEGGYANVKDDAGGETFAGVCRKYFPTLKVWKSFDKLSDPKAKKAYKPTQEEWDEIYDVYYKKFYIPVKGDYFDNEELAFAVFDFGVNAGVGTSIKQLQKVLGITQDGKCGPQTIGTANAQSRVLPRFIEAKKAYYNAIVARKPSQKKFLKGWLRRAEQTLHQAVQ